MDESDSEQSINSDEEVEETITEEERDKIRDKVSNLSFEDLQKLKEKMGLKLFHKAVSETVATRKKTSFKRANKNRPREMSSKIRPSFKQKRVVVESKLPEQVAIARDPRFDPLCGIFDKETFGENYKFLGEVRKNEKSTLEKELQECEDEGRKKQIKYLLQRMNNQIREQEKKEKQVEKIKMDKLEMKSKLRDGQKPFYKKKSEKRIEDLVSKYEELKSTNKLQKHIEKRTKKLVSKGRKQEARKQKIAS